MGCGCGTRANRLLRRLGFFFEDPDRWWYAGSRGVVTFEMDILQHHFRLTVMALLARIMLGKPDEL